MNGLLQMRSMRVPGPRLHDAHAHLRDLGDDGFEGMALWCGELEGETFRVRETFIPEQRGLRTADGVCVYVAGDELHRLNVWLFERGLVVGAQLHSHPTNAYHSTTDDTYAIATLSGALSIVVRNFAADPFSLADCATYRLDERGRWLELSTAEACRLVQVED